MKRFKVGFYGGKFMPFHLGHLYCIQTAMEQCERVHVILFYGGDDELNILSSALSEEKEFLSVQNRLAALNEAKKLFPNIIISTIDVTQVKLPDGSEDWDGETPLVLAITGRMDAVYSSEPSYDDYFKRAYPWAEHVLVDPPRIKFPVSGTMLRTMKHEGKDVKKWII